MGSLNIFHYSTVIILPFRVFLKGRSETNEFLTRIFHEIFCLRCKAQVGKVHRCRIKICLSILSFLDEIEDRDIDIAHCSVLQTFLDKIV